MNIYDFTVKDNHGKEVSLGTYKGKVLLVVNTATKCGLTPQYADLEKLYKDLNAEGFELLDFPCNQFLEQAPEDSAGIDKFCTLNYGTTFPRFAKVNVNGPETAPLFKWLKEQAPEAKETSKSLAFEKKVKQYTPGIADADIKWNFGKFLIDRQGNVVARFAPAYTPKEVEAEIKKIL
jgi:glutathione peroxidase